MFIIKRLRSNKGVLGLWYNVRVVTCFNGTTELTLFCKTGFCSKLTFNEVEPSKDFQMQGNDTPFLKISQIIGDKKTGTLGIIPVSLTAWYKGVAEGRYPKPIKLGKRASAWKRSDIEALIKRIGGE